MVSPLFHKKIDFEYYLFFIDSSIELLYVKFEAIIFVNLLVYANIFNKLKTFL